MITLTLEENRISNNGHIIPDFPIFLKNLPRKTELALILKTHSLLYHPCPLRKAVPFLKSAEFPPGHWVGEKALPKGQALVGGIPPSLFMRNAVGLLANRPLALKGAFLWADLVTQAYGPLPSGWTFIWHERHLMICYDGILRVSRPCSLIVEELSTILRYLKRFGYQEGMPLTLLRPPPFLKALPPLIRQETRAPFKFSLKGFTFSIPELISPQRLYAWPRKIRQTAYALTFFSALASTYLSGRIQGMMDENDALLNQMGQLPKRDPVDEGKMKAFAIYCQLAKDQSNPLPFFRYLIPFVKENAVATYFHWSNAHLTLHLEFKPSVRIDQFLLTLQSQLQGRPLAWKPEDGNPLKGVLTLENQAFDEQER